MEKVTIKRSAFAAKQEKPGTTKEYYVPLWNKAEER